MNTRKSDSDIAIIIPTYTNTKGLIDVIECINDHAKYKTIVVNNNPANVLTDIPGLEPESVVTERKNVGFAKASNDGAGEAVRKLSPEYLVFLNDDVIFQDDWIAQCIKEMKSEKWSATVPVLERPDGSVENVGYRVLKYGRVELETDVKSGRRIDGITAAAMVVETAVFNDLDGFDETFFAYLEDVDFCLRMKKAGYTFGVTKTARVTHTGQQTSSKMSTRKAWLDFKNWIKLMNRHWSEEEKRKYAGQIIVERMKNLSGIFKSL